MPRPAPYPDVYVYPHQLPAVWSLTLQSSGIPVDLSNSDVTAFVYDKGVEVGQLLLTRDEDEDGVLKFALPSELFAKLSRYSQWELFEATVLKDTLVRGKIVKQP